MRPLILIGENSTKVTERALLKSAGGGSDGRATDTLTAAPPTHIIYGLRVGQYSGNGLAALAPRRPLPSPRAAAASIELPGGGSVPLPVLPLLPSFLFPLRENNARFVPHFLKTAPRLIDPEAKSRDAAMK